MLSSFMARVTQMEVGSNPGMGQGVLEPMLVGVWMVLFAKRMA
jgi:hypothetical protein